MSGAACRRADGNQDGVPLGPLLDVLGSAADPGCRRLEPDVPAHDVVLLDEEAVGDTRGCVVIANGVDPAGPRWEELLSRLREAGAVAILVRAPAATATGSLLQRLGGPSVVMVDRSLSWDDAYHLLRSSLATQSARDRTAGWALSRIPVGDLFALANALAVACRGAVSIEDPQRRVLAHSSVPGHEVDETRRQGILARRVPPDAVDEGLYRRLVRRGGVLADHADAELPRLAVPVTAGGENLGSIWLIAAPGTVSPNAPDILADAADVAAVHLLQARAAQDLERRLRRNLVARLLGGSLSAEHVARRLGLPSAPYAAVVALDLGSVGEEPDQGDRDRVLDQLADLVSLHLQGSQGTVAVAHEGAVYAVVPIEEEAASVLLAPTDRVVQNARRELRLPVRAAIGVVRSLESAPLGRQQVDHLLRVMDRDPSGPAVALVEARRHEVALQELAAFARGHPWLLEASAAAAMTAVDDRRGTRYAATVSVFLDCLGNSEAAARRLHIHPNTLRYRLRRVSEEFGVDLMDPAARLVLALGLRSLLDAAADD